jgi:transposase
MSADPLSRAFGISGDRVTQTSWEQDAIVLCLEQPRQKLRCSACGSRDVHRKGAVSREFKTLPIGSQAVRLRLAVPRVVCQTCRLDRQVPLGLSEPKKTYTKCFARYVLELAQLMTVNDVARHLDVSWDIVRGIIGDDLQRRFGRPKLKHLKRLAIDEIYVGKTHKFLTVVLDLDAGRIVFVGDGKGESALKPFWKRLRHSHAKIEAVAADLSPAYGLEIRTALPDAALVFDRFHLVKLLNEHLTELRRELQREAEEGLQKRVLKGTRWLLLKHPANLDDTRDER